MDIVESDQEDNLQEQQKASSPPNEHPPKQPSGPTVKALYDTGDYFSCIEQCRAIWKNEPQQREGIRFIYAWSIYRHVLKQDKASTAMIDKALRGIARLCPETGPLDPLTLSALRAAYLHLDAATPRPAHALLALQYVQADQLGGDPEPFKGKKFPSLRERYYMLLSKALAKDAQPAEAIRAIEACFADSSLTLTDKNPLHLQFRKAQCLHMLEEHEQALKLALDVEPQLAQSYIAMHCGHCSLALERYEEALGHYAAAMLANRKVDFSLPALDVIATRYTSLDVAEEIACDHARLDNLTRDANNWPIKEYQVLPEIDDDSRSPQQILKKLRKLWQEWEPLRYSPSSGHISNWILDGKLGFVKDEKHMDDLIVKPSGLKTSTPPAAGTSVAYRRRRAYDRKKNKLGWEAVEVIPC